MSSKKIGRYEIRSELGRGGMATVYLAYDPVLEREVALKVLPTYFAHEPEFSARFAREAKIVAALEHHAIVSMYDYGEDGEWPYFVMQVMKGGSLKEKIEQGPLSMTEAARVLKRVGSALDRAHNRNLIHRDLKPGNILFDGDGNAYLTDFGIVKIAEASENYTQTGNTLGTPAYMSPEQARGVEEIDGRSDIYALGVILYEMLTGDVPYKSETTLGQAMMHVMDPLPEIMSVNPDLPPVADEIIKKAMAKKREDRYATASELATAVEAVAEGRTTAVANATPEVAATPPKPEAEPETVPEPVAARQPEPEPVAAPVTAVVPSAQKEVVETATAVTPPPPAKKGGIPTWAYAVVGLAVIAIIAVFALSGGDEGGEEISDNPDTSGQVITVMDEPEPTNEPELTDAPELMNEPELTDGSEPVDEPAIEGFLIEFDNEEDWPKVEEQLGEAGEFFGEAFVDLEEETYVVVSNYDGAYCVSNELIFGPGYYRVEALAAEGALNNGFGLALEREEESYEFLISSDGFASVQHWDAINEELTLLTPGDEAWFSHEAISQDLGVWSFIEVTVWPDGEVIFNVNEEEVAHLFTDISGEGTVCLTGGFATGEPTVIFYDNFYFEPIE
jgi:predicted Ser/Thr protein kinase